MSFHAEPPSVAKRVFLRVEEAFDRPFGNADNPLRHLGAYGLYLLWLVVGSGLYLYAVLDTGIEAVYRSIGELSDPPWQIGGLLRSIHRYAADGLMVVMLLHLLREACYGRFRGFRSFSWLTGVPLIWLAFVAGIGGYWLVWDQLAQVSAIAGSELLDGLPLFSEPVARNFLTPEALSDRFFTLLVFIHIGVPLLLILGLWAHVQRIAHVDYLPSGRAMLATLTALLVLAWGQPVQSQPPADLTVVPGAVGFDWFILFIHPLSDLLGSTTRVWVLLFATTAVLFALPLLPSRAGVPAVVPVAVVEPAHCTGCDRCLADCPYAAISMVAHPSRPGNRLAVVDADSCASCGLCAGSCPSSTPFRRQAPLRTGIDLPQRSVDDLREHLEAELARLNQTAGRTRIVVFSCRHAADITSLTAADTAVIPLLCAGQLPPSFIEYALRGGADGVMLGACRAGGCEFRLGERWLADRLSGKRPPPLRNRIPVERWQTVYAGPHDRAELLTAVAGFRSGLETLDPIGEHLPPYFRKVIHDA
ncbi:MAG TPA: cytochrome b N-terminal domain-containing protein [Accumulibacter sp.]|nr:cytochrome b N-terminal domain-containing protein [Accumulibacter sp.]HMW18116.1 cytochrome b N-terminal domain-containing protein [Accumulibacter sp.]HMX21925.1 cytochrome b N-terminal domain-containing protein [Accumulibacter sp.]HNC16892.1 cytochrome b N-terminal domain-containing protein [Accumulibacter sp.]HND79528.1 cytochrome b N-terminal domain-containing protein [Accumulibacter sp.]